MGIVDSHLVTCAFNAAARQTAAVVQVQSTSSSITLGISIIHKECFNDFGKTLPSVPGSFLSSTTKWGYCVVFCQGMEE